MLPLDLFSTDPARVAAGLTAKNVADAEAVVAQVNAQNQARKVAIAALDAQRAEMNAAAKSIGQLMQQGKTTEAEAAKQSTAALKQRIAEGEAALREIEAQLHAQLAPLPNLPHASVPVGRDAAANVVAYEGTLKATVPENARPHWELAATHGLIDFEAGAKVTGAGFPFYIGQGARLQRALIAYFLDRASAAGYLEVQPPYLVNEASAYGTGQLPDKDGQMYTATADTLYLIPTAEVPVTNLFRDEILAEAELPLKRCAYSPCFRREAGSYGKDVRGLNRLHQFDKVEIVQITTPEASYDALEAMVAHVRGLLEELELQHRVLLLSTGDSTAASAKTYDLEVFSAGQGRWLEVSSVSNFEGYQARRMQLRYRPSSDKKPATPHTLNGSALALPRVLAALLENHQQADGSIVLPEVLRPYAGFERIG